MIRISLLIPIIFLTFNSLAQTNDPQIDSLKRILASQKIDSIKVNTLNSIGSLYLDIDLNEAIKYGNEARDLAEKVKYRKGLGYAYKLIGLGYAYLNNNIEADINFKESLEVFESINFKEGISNMLSNLGSLNSTLGEETKAIDYFLRSLKIAEEINNDLRIASCYVGLGNVYSNKSATTDKALDYFLKALPIFEKIQNKPGIGTTAVNIGEIYFKKGMYDSALTFFQTSIKIYQGTPDAALALSYLGEIYAEKNDFENAYRYHNQAVEVTERLGAQQFLARSLLSLAKTQRKKGDLTSSVESYKKALKISEEIKARIEIKDSYESLADIYAELGDFKNAYAYNTLLISIKDTLYNSDEDKKIQQLQFNFDLNKKEAEIELQDATIQRQKIVTYATAISGFLLLIVAVGSYNRYKYVNRTNKIIKDERDKSKELLLNILPEETARELETNGSAQSRYYESATVLFTDFKGFSTIAGKLSPQELVAELNDYFMAFDEIMGKHNLEKIKTIGDAYMCAGGIPLSNNTHPLDAVKAGLAMQDFMMKKNAGRKENNLECWELRVGIHTGPIVAGVVGKKKYAYDIWGDTVNIASRMESNGEAGKVNISDSTYQRIKEHYQCLYRGKISAKNIGEVDMYFIESKISVPVSQLALS